MNNPNPLQSKAARVQPARRRDPCSSQSSGYLVEVCRTAVLDHCITMTIATARAVSNTRQNSARERTTTRLVR